MDIDYSSPKYQRQIQLEEAARALAEERGNSIVQDALDKGRYPDLPVGRRLLAAAYEQCLADLETSLSARCAGVGAKHRSLLRRIPGPVLVSLGLRFLLSAVTHPLHRNRKFQSVLTEVGRALESEAIVACAEKVAPVYLERTLQHLERGYSRSINHRHRTFLVAAEATLGEWGSWEPSDRHGAARLLLQVIWGTGLFEWVDEFSEGRKMKFLAPSPALAAHLQDLKDHSMPVVRFDPMIVPPEPWTSQGAGGYHTPWMRVHAPMIALRSFRKEQRDWVFRNLDLQSPAVCAMNKAQAVPYRINRAVKDWLAKALPIPEGVMGLPSHGMAQKPEFPFREDWERGSASAEEVEVFESWKRRSCAWYQESSKKAQTKRTVALALQSMARFQDEPELYFPTYLDYRGRVYFRGTLHPQAHDAIKGCLEFANGEPLGDDGLFWLKVHVASCAGFDKADFGIRARWTEENWASILAWLEDPLASEPPEPDTAFCFLAAALALREALQLQDPREYICHIPVAMDATCSGLQHFSAMFRDPIGAEFTNLFDSGGTEKRDIYMRCAEVAEQNVVFTDPNVREFWAGRRITRGMAKRPIMTFAYGSTLKSNIDYVSDGLIAEGCKALEDGGKALYSLNKLSVPVAQALRIGVQQTVPAASAAMEYFQALARRAAGPLSWVTPSGMPVCNYVEGDYDRRVAIQSMGITNVLIRQRDGLLNRRKVAAAISPNIVHSMDAAHLCLTLVDAPFDIVPIHDSFAALPSNVAELHRILREQFVELYATDLTEQFDTVPLLEKAEAPVKPSKGSFDIRKVLTSRFIFC